MLRLTGAIPTNNSCMHLSASYALRTAEAVSLYKRYPDSKLNGMQYFDTVQIIWTTAADPVSQITFEDALGPYGFKQLLASQTYMVQLQIDTDGRLVVRDCSEPPYSSSPAIWFADGRQIMQLVYAHGYNIQYPIDFVGIPVPTKVPNARYVAMGDSFSSGEGNPPFEPGTDTSDNKCHRSSQAYPRLLQNDPDLNLGSMAFVACSGATTDSIVYGGNVVSSGGEDPQMSVLSSSTRIVTVTIGGNDVKFKEFASACVVTNCASSSSAYQESWDIMTNASNVDYLPNKLETAYDAIAEGLTAANTAARVYVIGYPKVVTHDSWASTTSSDPWNCLYMSENSSSGAEAIVQKLNEVIHDAVENFDDQRFVYVDPLATGSPFIGNELCRSGGYFYGASAALGGSTSYVFHPNVNGQNAYKQIVADAIN